MTSTTTAGLSLTIVEGRYATASGAPSTVMELERHLPLEEQTVLELLRKIEGIASDAELKQALYEFRGLLPVLESPTRIIVDTYLALRQSDYFSTALSLVSFVIQGVHACPPAQLEQLREYVRRNSTYEADEHYPSLTLRLAMSNIANHLMSDVDKDQLITLAAHQLGLHTDKFGGDLLKAFDTLEKRGFLDPKDSRLVLVRKWLGDIKRKDLVEELDNYEPHRPIRVAVMKDVKRKHSVNDVLRSALTIVMMLFI